MSFNLVNEEGLSEFSIRLFLIRIKLAETEKLFPKCKIPISILSRYLFLLIILLALFDDTMLYVCCNLAIISSQHIGVNVKSNMGRQFRIKDSKTVIF